MRGFGEVAERLRRSTVQVGAGDRRSGGSGVIWSSGGLILTNAHVARAPELRVELWDGRRLDGRVVARDQARDLASVRIEANSLDMALPSDTAVRPGELVLAVGSPFGFAGALSTGVVHSVGRVAGMGSGTWILADARLAPGNSGGPLANAAGEVVGINTAVVHGLGAAIPAEVVADYLREAERAARRPVLGVTLRPLPHGLLILDLDPAGAAAAASLRPGDILLGSVEDLGQALDSGRGAIPLRFLRGGPRQQVREAFVRLRARAEAA